MSGEGVRRAGISGASINTEDGTFGDVDDVTLAGVGARTASASGPWVDLGDRGTAQLELVVTARGGTAPTLDVTVETSKDKEVTDGARSVGTFAQQTAIGTVRKGFAPLDRYVRVSWTIGGSATPTFNFSVSGQAR